MLFNIKRQLVILVLLLGFALFFNCYTALVQPGQTRYIVVEEPQTEEELQEAEEDDRIRSGLVLVAPGDYHLQVGRRGIIHLFRGPQVCNVRPAADITMESVARVFKAKTIGVVLTGMGEDGAKGGSMIKEAGGLTIAEHESTCIVYGMPAALLETGNADLVLPIALPGGWRLPAEGFQALWVLGVLAAWVGFVVLRILWNEMIEGHRASARIMAEFKAERIAQAEKEENQ